MMSNNISPQLSYLILPAPVEVVLALRQEIHVVHHQTIPLPVVHGLSKVYKYIVQVRMRLLAAYAEKVQMLTFKKPTLSRAPLLNGRPSKV